MSTIYPHTKTGAVGEVGLHHLCCNRCGKSVSSGFLPARVEDVPDGKLVVRAWIECPECMEQSSNARTAKGPTAHEQAVAGDRLKLEPDPRD